MRYPITKAVRGYGKHLAAAFIALSTMGTAAAATLSVGPGKSYSAPCAAFAAAKDGDIVEIAGGTTYRGDVCYVVRNRLTIRGVNGRPKIDAAGKAAARKGTWIIAGSDITIENVEMVGARVPDRNGAAIRFEGTNFTMRRSFLHDNENGILSGPNTKSDFLIEYSEFGHNGHGDGQSHNLYIGHIKSLTFRYNFSHDANIGHNLKSRAETNTIVYNRFSSLNPGQTGSTAAGRPSYEIDLPNAGTAYIIGNVIHQPATPGNATMLAFGEEGASNAAQDLYVVNNTFLNDVGHGGTFLFISGRVSTPALIQNNIFSGIGTVSTQVAAIQKTNYASVAPGFVNRAAFDLHPIGSMLVIGAATDPGTSATGVSLTPVAQYKGTASGEARPAVGGLDIGAYEATNAVDPLPATWTDCAREGAVCAFGGTRQVRFGANGAYAYKMATASIACTNASFGDPAPNVAKTCSVAGTTTTTAPAPTPAPVTWIRCASENGTCAFSGTRDVRYGANNVFVTKLATGRVACSNAVFGDPLKNVVKSCAYASVTR